MPNLVEKADNPPAAAPSPTTRRAAIGLTLIWIVGTVAMYYEFVAGSNNWDHALVLYNALTSVGFTAVGVLLGTQVQQVNLAAAEKKASDAKAEADKKGMVLKAIGRTVSDDRGGAQSASKGFVGADVGGEPQPNDGASAQIAEVRSHLFSLI